MPGKFIVRAAYVDTLADWVFSRKVEAGQLFVDDRYRGLLGPVLFGEGPALDQRNTHSPKVVRAYYPVIRASIILGWRKRTTLDGEPPVQIIAAERQVIDYTDRLNARRRPDPLKEPPVKGRLLARFAVLSLR